MLNIIQGKPGSGKSYFAVTKIIDCLVNLCEDEKRTKKEGVRRVYTNLKLDNFEVDDYVERITASGVKASKYIVYLDNDFFWETDYDGSKVLCHWWEKFVDAAFIIIDEVQYYLASNANDKKSEGYNKDFELYISTHRHKAQDLLFITQHQDNILRSCLSMSEGTYIVTNYKNFVIPFLGIPFSDFDVVRHAWGNDYQAANVDFGLFVGRAFKKQSSQTLVLKDDIFKLYKSHNSNIDSDRPALELSRLGSLFWLFRRHALQLSIKLIILIGVVMLLWSTFSAVPKAIGGLFNGGKSVKVTDTNKSTDSPQPIKSADPKVVIIGDNYLILDNGQAINIGDSFRYGGKQVFLVSVDLLRGSFRLSTDAPVSTED